MGITTSSSVRRDHDQAANGGRRRHDVEDDWDSFSSGTTVTTSLSSGATGGSLSWSLVRSENLATWKYASVLWGFDPRIDYTSNVKARLQPWCTAGRHFVIKHDSTSSRHAHQRPHCVLTIVEGCFRQDTHVRLDPSYSTRLHTEPDPAGHYLKSAQVSPVIMTDVAAWKILNLCQRAVTIIEIGLYPFNRNCTFWQLMHVCADPKMRKITGITSCHECLVLVSC